MNLIDRFGDLFQASYVARDLDRAVETAAVKLGIDNFFTCEAVAPVWSRGELQELCLRVAVANNGSHQFEIIEPVSGPTWIYTDGKELKDRDLVFHHFALAVVGPYSLWEQTISQLEKDSDEIVQVSALEPGAEPQAMFAYVDNRRTLGHFTEYLWWSPALDGTPMMPHIRQGA